MSTLCPISASGTHALSKTWLLRLDQIFVVIKESSASKAVFAQSCSASTTLRQEKATFEGSTG